MREQDTRSLIRSNGETERPVSARGIRSNGVTERPVSARGIRSNGVTGSHAEAPKASNGSNIYTKLDFENEIEILKVEAEAEPELATRMRASTRARKSIRNSLTNINVQHQAQTYIYRRWAMLGLVSVAWVVTAFAFFYAEGYDVVTSMYGLTQIITSVGYGDVLPSSETGKIVMSILMLLSTSIVAGAVSNIFDVIIDRHEAALQAEIDSKEELISGGGNSAVSKQAKVQNGPWKKVASAGAVFLTFLLVGTVSFAILEPCSCSFGHSQIDGCEQDRCRETGGAKKTWIDTWYMSVATLTTVGFGDEVALTEAGRVFGIVWMLAGVASMVNFVESVTELLQEEKHNSKYTEISKELFEQMDADNSGTLDIVEFLTLQLVSNGQATQDEISSYLRQFELLDHSGDGQLSLDEVKRYYGK